MLTRPGLVTASLLLALAVPFTCRGNPKPPPITPPEPHVAATAPSDHVCTWTDAPPAIDGKGDDPAWRAAPVIDGFRQPWVSADQRPAQATRAKLLWDREHLYFLAELDDTVLFAKPTQRNGRVWENDCFELFLKPASGKPGYYEFEVDHNDTTLELFIPARGKGGFDEYVGKTPFKFDTAVTKRAGKGWTVEGRIRWADLAPTGGRPNVDEVWAFNLCRCDYSDAKTVDLSCVAPLTKPSFHRYEEFATLRFAGGDGKAKAFGIDRRTPWTQSKLAGSPDPAPPYTVVPAFKDLKIFQPIYVAEEPGTDDLLIIQHLGNWAGPGKIVRVKNDPAATEAKTIHEADELIYSLCFHPRYAENRYVYVYSNGPVNAKKHFNRLYRYTMDEATGKLDPASKFQILEEWESNGHNGGGMSFGPDGMLWLTSGDTSNDSDVENRGQDLRHLSAALLRIDVDRPDAGKNYGIPKDNPFVGRAGVRPEIWAHGFRNPWRMCIDAKTGAVWVGQNGQDLWEPVYYARKGANYGWPVYEGSRPFHPHRPLAPTTLDKPVVEHHHAEARSLTGGVVYYGEKFPDLNGAYVYGDFSTGRVWALRYDGEKILEHREIARTTCQIVNFYADRKGDLFISDDGGGVFKLAPLPKDQSTPPFPRRLSETGLFVDTAKHEPDPALIPYDVNAPLWSDGAAKERFIALPENTTIDYTPTRGWNFPSGAALVKTFALDLEAGNPASRRRLETRVMLKQGKEWAGYTYIWNDAQTDAELAPSSGVDQALAIKDPAAPGGERKQTWHYPSRAECMICHSRAANFALGLSELQMNRDFTYPSGHTDNQLRTLEHLGVLRVDAGLKSRKPAADQRQIPPSNLLTQAPEKLSRLVDPADPAADLNLRARSYLHGNCYHCHVEAGGGNASVDLEFTTAAARTKMFDAPAQANVLGHPDARLIATGRPDRSILLHRMTVRGAHQMPPAGSNLADPAAVKLITEWVATMPASTQPAR